MTTDSRLIRGGTVVTTAGEYEADVLVERGRIVAIGEDLNPAGVETIDARGCYVLPGGIDGHTHIDFAPGPFRTSDDFTSGTEAAVLGGTTCVLDFALQIPGAPLVEAVERRLADVARNAPVADVGLHLIIREEPLGDREEEIGAVIERGVLDFKLFLAHRHEVMIEDDLAYRLMGAIARAGGLAMVHAENGYVIDAMRDDLAAIGDTGPGGHVRSRPPETEYDAVVRAIQFAKLTSARTYLVHVSTAEAVDAIASARAEGVEITAETCAQYLLLDPACLESGEDPWQFMFAPPPRVERHRDALWRGLASGVISTVASDHSPYQRADKSGGAHRDFRTVPNGIPGVGERLALLHEFGVRQRGMSMRRLVDVFATTPARVFGLDRKGAVRVGADADLVVFDPTEERRLGTAASGSRCDFNAYEGTRVTGWVDTTLVRGVPVVSQGRRTDAQGTGRFVARGRRGAAARLDGTPGGALAPAENLQG